MTYEVAEIEAGGRRLGVVRADHAILKNGEKAKELVLAAREKAFPGMPVVLLHLDRNLIPTWFGRPDLVSLASGFPPQKIRWREVDIPEKGSGPFS